jgi:hypothetical protein
MQEREKSFAIAVHIPSPKIAITDYGSSSWPAGANTGKEFISYPGVPRTSNFERLLRNKVRPKSSVGSLNKEQEDAISFAKLWNSPNVKTRLFMDLGNSALIRARRGRWFELDLPLQDSAII